MSSDGKVKGERKMNKRMEALSKLVAYDNKQIFIRLIDFPEQSNTPTEIIEWANKLNAQIERAIKILRAPKRLPAVELEDQNLLNYLELLMGEEMTPYPRLVVRQSNHLKPSLEAISSGEISDAVDAELRKRCVQEKESATK